VNCLGEYYPSLLGRRGGGYLPYGWPDLMIQTLTLMLLRWVVVLLFLPRPLPAPALALVVRT
jgi:hypothetical protein